MVKLMVLLTWKYNININFKFLQTSTYVHIINTINMDLLYYYLLHKVFSFNEQAIYKFFANI